MGMLILSRRVGETIYIGDDIKITVTRIRPSSVRLGVEAPKAVDIDRTEVRESKQQGADHEQKKST